MDAEDRLASVATPDGTVWRYAYDPLGRRISKQSPLETVHFTWDGATLCEQTTEDTTLTWDYGLRPLTQTERRHGSNDDRFFAIVTDLIGTPTELVDESGALAWRTRTTLWGTTTWTRDATGYTPLRFRASTSTANRNSTTTSSVTTTQSRPATSLRTPWD